MDNVLEAIALGMADHLRGVLPPGWELAVERDPIVRRGAITDNNPLLRRMAERFDRMRQVEFAVNLAGDDRSVVVLLSGTDAAVACPILTLSQEFFEYDDPAFPENLYARVLGLVAGG